MTLQIGYCTNVHAGTTLDQARENLDRYACSVRDRLGLTTPLGIGLWLAEPAARELVESPDELDRFKDWLTERQLNVFTMNGFPQHDFHQKSVKAKVYQPTWWQAERRDYTLALAKILCHLLPDGGTGSISTLPIAWHHPRPTAEQIDESVRNLATVADAMADLEAQTDKQLVLAIEPEPGCHIGDSAQARIFLQRNFLRAQTEYGFTEAQRERYRRHLTICHDICHSAVMREDQRRELRSYRELGIRIGKVQVSSAIDVDWDRMSAEERKLAFDQLSQFAEDRYLHQTTTRGGPVGSVRLTTDLPELLKPVSAPERLVGNWCVHFHVPITEIKIHQLRTTQHEIATCLRSLLPYVDDDAVFTGHFEVETYAWNVLPNWAQNETDLSQSITDEMKYLLQQIAMHSAPSAPA